jgi:predicted ATPase
MYWDVMLYNHLGQLDQAEARAGELVEFCREWQVDYWLPQGEAQLGWIQAERGDLLPGIARIRQGMDEIQRMGGRMQQTFYLALLARLTGRSGDTAGGLALAQEALETVERTGERLFETEIHRSRGLLLEQLGQAQAAEQAYQRAMEIACFQGARTQELRAAVGLGRLLARQGKAAQAREIIAPLTAWFREGLDLPDLVEARQFLEANDLVTGSV